LTISGGVAAFPVNGTNSTELIMHADQALYQAKAAGRNRVIRYRGVEIGDVDDRHDDADPYSTGETDHAVPPS
jgi:predicted signal transduction protein with EAL and GGDEF domain